MAYGMKEAARTMPNQPPGTVFTAPMKPLLTSFSSHSKKSGASGGMSSPAPG